MASQRSEERAAVGQWIAQSSAGQTAAYKVPAFARPSTCKRPVALRQKTTFDKIADAIGAFLLKIV